MTHQTRLILLLAALMALAGPAANAAPNDGIYPVAVFPFVEKGSGLNGYGQKVSDALYADLVSVDHLYLVDRADFGKIINESELNLSGMVSPEQAIQLGRLSGAKILVTGSVLEIDGSILIVAKVIGTETGRMFGASVKGAADADTFELTGQAAMKIVGLIDEKAGELVAPALARGDSRKMIGDAIGDKPRPSVAVSIGERHVSSNTMDPAAETELMLVFSELGFDVLEWDGVSESRADVLVKGEGFSEFASRQGNIVSVNARLEVKAVDRVTGEVIAVERQNEVEIDLSEQIAGKHALQQAAASLAERLIPKLVDNFNPVP